MRAARSEEQHLCMARSLYAFGHDAEPADGQSGDAQASTVPAAWNASERVTFDEPNHVAREVQQRTQEAALQARLITLGLVLVSAAVSAAVLTFSGR